MHKKTNFLTKLILLVLLIGLIYYLAINIPNLQFNTLSDTDALKQLSSLQEKYYVTTAFSTNPAQMNDYLTELSVLRAKSRESAAKIIDAELYSALSFYHLTKTMATYQTINFSTENCKSESIVNTRKQLKLAEDNSVIAIEKINSLTATEKEKIRTNLLETIQNYQLKINQLTQVFGEKC